MTPRAKHRRLSQSRPPMRDKSAVKAERLVLDIVGGEPVASLFDSATLHASLIARPDRLGSLARRSSRSPH